MSQTLTYNGFQSKKQFSFLYKRKDLDTHPGARTLQIEISENLIEEEK